MLSGNTGEHFPAGFQTGKRNYGIGEDGRIGMYVEEKNRSWCSSSNANDQRAVTIECASDTTEPYAFKDVVYQKLITLCADICKRNGKKKLLWLGEKDKTLSYEPKSDEMVLTVHRWFANKSCPGNWMYARMGDLAEKVTTQLGGGISGNTETEHPEKLTEGYYRVRKTWADVDTEMRYRSYPTPRGVPTATQVTACLTITGSISTRRAGLLLRRPKMCRFLVQVSISDLNIRKGPGTDYAKTGKFTGKGVFTIMEVKSGQGSTAGWGRLKSGAGWISLDYTSKIK